MGQYGLIYRLCEWPAIVKYKMLIISGNLQVGGM